jgi:NADH dehydrogenase [ubiquinone] 1 alpha subcomplex assembly factor 7
MNEQVGTRLRRRIDERGPLAFDEFMREALYGPSGFYDGTPVGERGHFVTSPHAHPVFSRLVGVAVEELWERLERPVPFRLVEVGAGDGAMARELIGGFARAGIELEYAAVEASPGARTALESLTPRVVRELAALPPLEPGVVVANELLDNLPFRRVRRRDGEIVEVLVGLDGDRFVEVEIPADPQLRSFAAPLSDRGETTYPVGALAFVDELAAAMRRGYALLVDYGSATGPSEAAHGYRDQRLVADVLADPGTVDITAGVDLGAVAARARARGLEAIGLVDQSSALRALGYDEWSNGARSNQVRFLEGGRGAEAARTWDARNRAAALVDPIALGRLRWLLVSTSGLATPTWFARARALARLD